MKPLPTAFTIANANYNTTLIMLIYRLSLTRKPVISNLNGNSSEGGLIFSDRCLEPLELLKIFEVLFVDLICCHCYKIIAAPNRHCNDYLLIFLKSVGLHFTR